MQTIELETTIAAPPRRCFLLSLSIDLHMQSAARSGERAVAGVTHGLIGPGETVTWEGRHFGVMLRHKTQITRYEMPTYFQDVMVDGMFRSFVHDHWFVQGEDGGTFMRDVLRFAAPLGPLGRIVETVALRRHLTGFLLERNEVVRRIAEGPKETWHRLIET